MSKTSKRGNGKPRKPSSQNQLDSEVKRKPEFPGKKNGFKPKSGQPKADSDSKRINLDNARISRVEKDIEKGSKMPGKNDISFWNRNPEMMKSAGSLPFATIAGSTLRNSHQYGASGYTVPGILAFYYAPTFGAELYPTAVNKANDNQFSFLVHANSRNYSYDSPDLGLLQQAGSEVFAAIANAIRAYGLAKYSIEENNYTPNALLKAVGFNPTDFRANLGQIWFDINDMIVETEKIWVPKEYTYLQRNYDLNSSVYKDGDGMRAQYYVFTRTAWYKYNSTVSSQGGGLIKVGRDLTSGNLYNWESYKAMVWELINALNASSDRGVIYGDLLNAYGASNIYKMLPVDAGYKVIPEYNAEILTQVENLTVCEVIPESFIQVQPNSTSAYGPKVVTVWSSSTQTKAEVETDFLRKSPPQTSILNFHFDGQPSPEAIMIATRFKTASLQLRPGWKLNGNVPSATAEVYQPITCGTEIIKHVLVWVNPPGGGLNTQSAPLYLNGTYFMDVPSDDKPAVYELQLADLRYLAAFDWHPFCYYSSKYANGNGFVSEWLDIAGDFDNYIQISLPELVKLHDTALYSMYNATFTG